MTEKRMMRGRWPKKAGEDTVPLDADHEQEHHMKDLLDELLERAAAVDDARAEEAAALHVPPPGPRYDLTVPQGTERLLALRLRALELRVAELERDLAVARPTLKQGLL